MSSSRATVITTGCSSIPLVGDDIATWLGGGCSVANPALNHFYALHYLLPFVIGGVVVLHILALHVTGSNNPDGIDVQGPQDPVPFTHYFPATDAVGLGVFMLFYAALVLFAPNMLGDAVT